MIKHILLCSFIVSVTAYPVNVRLWNGVEKNFDHTSLEFAEAAAQERKMAIYFNRSYPKWASPDLRDVMQHWCLKNIPAWELYPETWGKDQYGQDFGGRFAYINRNKERLVQWISSGNITPFDALTS